MSHKPVALSAFRYLVVYSDGTHLAGELAGTNLQSAGETVETLYGDDDAWSVIVVEPATAAREREISRRLGRICAGV